MHHECRFIVGRWPRAMDEDDRWKRAHAIGFHQHSRELNVSISKCDPLRGTVELEARRLARIMNLVLFPLGSSSRAGCSRVGLLAPSR